MADTISLGGHPRILYRRQGIVFAEHMHILQSSRLTTAPHGMSRTPYGTDTWLECTDEEFGYSVGDKIPVMCSGAARVAEVIVGFDPVNTIITAGGGAVHILDHTEGSTHNPVSMTMERWRLTVVPYTLEVLE